MSHSMLLSFLILAGKKQQFSMQAISPYRNWFPSLCKRADVHCKGQFLPSLLCASAPHERKDRPHLAKSFFK